MWSSYLRHCSCLFSSLIHLASLSLLIRIFLFLSSAILPFLLLSFYISRYYWYTHCEDLGNEVDPPSSTTCHPTSSVVLLFLSPVPPAAAKSLAGLLRRQKFNIAVTLRWLYVLTVSPLCARITYYYRRETERLNGDGAEEWIPCHGKFTNSEYKVFFFSSHPPSFPPRFALFFPLLLHRGNLLYERSCFICVKGIP